MPERFLSLKQVTDRTSFSRSSIYRHIAEGTFPKQYTLPGKKVVWRESEILKWQAAVLACPVDELEALLS